MFKFPTNRLRVSVFLAVLSLLSGLVLLVPGSPPGLYMLVPAVTTVLLMVVFTRDGWRREGWRQLGFGRLRSSAGVLLPALLVPLVVVSVGYLALPVLGAAVLKSGQGWAALAISLLGLVPAATLSALLEEVGWRGYLLPKLAGLGSVAAGWTLGLIWAAWHLPLMLVGSYHGGEGLDWTLLLFVLTVVAFGFLANELRMQTGSIWPAALLHGAHNAAWHVWREVPQEGHAALVNLVAGEKGLVTLALYGAAAVAVCLLPGMWTARYRLNAGTRSSTRLWT
ncbi:CPBP family intramembrane glutamic endopeptidase [Deinococcus apachensis]|uniref:CPBP family intramembrane glutamic endopeptidase n=1 Tax=Deinococcus apachensis TaxID=309886 RepID=UPI0003716DA0|nr:CPBP family intramembrane glutamic endopeptidase [Deinococcus apachensis]